MKTITGSGAVVGALCGVYTFRYRQSSLSVPTPVLSADDACSHELPNFVASRGGAAKAPAGCGGIQRRSPTGGCAYGMPRYSQVVPAFLPAIAPWVTAAVQSTVDADVTEPEPLLP